MGAPMKVAIIGAGRKRNGIGEFIAKYLHANGATVSCVLGSTTESAQTAAAHLGRYGIRAKAYTDFSEMIRDAGPDAVAIASPIPTHEAYIERCIQAGVHVFCEKPLLSPEIPDPAAAIESLFRQAHQRGVVIAMNAQWPFCLPAYEDLCGKIDPSQVERFAIRLSPMSSGREMIPDSVPHALSLLHCVAGAGRIRDLSFEGGDDFLRITFSYLTRSATCRACVDLVRESAQPRTFSFGFNGRVAQRLIDPGTYTIHLTCLGKTLKIADPLELSVRDFLAAAGSGGNPALGERHIVETASLLREIYTAYSHT